MITRKELKYIEKYILQEVKNLSVIQASAIVDKVTLNWMYFNICKLSIDEFLNLCLIDLEFYKNEK